MRVTIEHREEAGGIASQRRNYFVDCTVAFSEEERAIIKARDLYREGFAVQNATPLPSTVAIFGSGGMQAAGPLLIVASVVVGIAGGASEAVTGSMFISGIGLWIYGWLKGRRIDQRLETSDQIITVWQLLANPTFTVHASNAGYAKILEEEVREQLAALKALIQESAELPARQTFEL